MNDFMDALHVARVFVEDWRTLTFCAWALVGHWLFMRYLYSEVELKVGAELIFFWLSGPITWVRFPKLMRK